MLSDCLKLRCSLDTYQKGHHHFIVQEIACLDAAENSAWGSIATGQASRNRYSANLMSQTVPISRQNS
jgi:hypothetical protein